MFWTCPMCNDTSLYTPAQVRRRKFCPDCAYKVAKGSTLLRAQQRATERRHEGRSCRRCGSRFWVGRITDGRPPSFCDRCRAKRR